MRPTRLSSCLVSLLSKAFWSRSLGSCTVCFAVFCVACCGVDVPNPKLLG